MAFFSTASTGAAVMRVTVGSAAPPTVGSSDLTWGSSALVTRAWFETSRMPAGMGEATRTRKRTVADPPPAISPRATRTEGDVATTVPCDSNTEPATSDV